MADSLVLTFEVSRGDEFLFKEQVSAESVTIGKGPAAMLRVEDDDLADLQAVINQNDDGSLQVLDLVGQGTKVNGKQVVNALLSDGDTIEIGEIKIRVNVEGLAPAHDGDTENTMPVYDESVEDEEITDANVHSVGDIDLSKTDADVLAADISEDVMAFIMRSGTSQSDVGIDRSRPKVLEVAEIWGDVIMDVKHFIKGSKAVSLGTSTGYRWRILGTPIAWVSPAFAKFAWMVAPTLSEAQEEVRNDFYVPNESLPHEEFRLFEWRGNHYVCRFSSNWAGFIDKGEERHALQDFIESGEAKSVGEGIYELPLEEDVRVIFDELVKPQGALLLDRKKGSFNPLIRLREEFNQEMDQSVNYIK